MTTYLTACGGNLGDALELYQWNARVAAALMVPAHVAEVATRNAVDEALTELYGARWPWAAGFEKSLPRPQFGYKPFEDLRSVRSRQGMTTGKVIADLKFVFWQNMFTARHHQRVWNTRIRSLFPNHDGALPKDLRGRVYGDLEQIRLLRNRIAHHEPIFSRDLAGDLAKMLDLVHLRCIDTAGWVRSFEDATASLASRP